MTNNKQPDVREFEEWYADNCFPHPTQNEYDIARSAYCAALQSPSVANTQARDDSELPGMWEMADLIGGETDSPPRQQEQSGVAVAEVYTLQAIVPGGEVRHHISWIGEPPKSGTKLYLAPPTSTAIAAMVIKQAAGMLADMAEKERARKAFIRADHYSVCASHIRTLTPANAEAELEALMAKCVEYAFEAAGKGWWHGAPEAIVRRVLDEKGE